LNGEAGGFGPFTTGTEALIASALSAEIWRTWVALIASARACNRATGCTDGAAPRAAETATFRPPWMSANAAANHKAASATQTSMATTRCVEARVGASPSDSSVGIAKSLIPVLLCASVQVYHINNTPWSRNRATLSQQ